MTRINPFNGMPSNRKPCVKKEMKRFCGFQVDEEAFAVLQNSRPTTCRVSIKRNAELSKLVRTGYLEVIPCTMMSTPEKNKRYISYCLTEKGKEHVKRLEDWY